jgi:uncharacterized membrane protein (DUF485 family)
MEDIMFHEPAAKGGKDFASAYKTRLGAWLFLLYALIYAIFVAINVISPVSMEKTVIFGLNLAVVYGFGLILFALILALIYNHMCAVKEKELNISKECK